MPHDDKPEEKLPSRRSIFEITPELRRAMDAATHEYDLSRREEAFRGLMELRRRHAGFARRLVVRIYKPECENCYALERHRFEADDDSWQPPSIPAKDWRRWLRDYGVSERELRCIARKKATIECATCGDTLSYGIDNIYVFATPFEDYFPGLVGAEDRDPPKSPPRWVRRLVYDVYEGRCAGCGVALEASEATMDHILPRHQGGAGTLENIQLACDNCNGEEKGGKEPEPVYVWLGFLLVPSECSESDDRLGQI